jgi:hypothetical protein
MEIRPNLIIWMGVSEEFSEALRCAQDRIVMCQADFFTYLIDGGIIDLPRAKSVREYKQLHWLPVVFRPIERVHPAKLAAKSGHRCPRKA